MTPFSDTIIIGAGLSGLVVGHKLRRHHPDHRFVILEKQSAVGGAIRSFAEDGFLAEIGPHGFLDNCAESRELLAETGLERESVKAPLATFVRYVCRHGRLQMIPQAPLKIIRAPLVPWKDKFRVLGDLFREPLDGEPTVAKWAEHRFGRALLPYVDAVFTGTYAGDINELKIDAVMPGLRALEREYGSIIRGALAKARAARKRSRPGEKMRLPAMTSFPNGMGRLPEKLAESLAPGDTLILDCGATRIQRSGGGWLVEAAGQTLESTNLVLALPVNQALALMRDFEPAMPLKKIPEAWIATVVFGFQGASLPPGFGFLNPESEGRFTLGTLFSSNMFPNRAPAGHIVVETLVGGRRHPERLELADPELIRRALADLRGLLDLPADPVFTRVLRPQSAIPQPEKGYPALRVWRDELVRHQPGLFICGFGWDGIGINDMIKTATAVAREVGSGSRQRQDGLEVEKVYF